MQSSTLLKLSMAISITGIFLLLFLSNTQTLKLTNINEINELFLNKKIQIQGQITSIRNQTDFQIINLQDNTGKINIILNKKISLIKNQTINVIGRVIEYKTKYKNELEIQADEIMIIE